MKTWMPCMLALALAACDRVPMAAPTAPGGGQPAIGPATATPEPYSVVIIHATPAPVARDGGRPGGASLPARTPAPAATPGPAPESPAPEVPTRGLATPVPKATPVPPPPPGSTTIIVTPAAVPAPSERASSVLGRMQEGRWGRAAIRPQDRIRLDKAVALFERNKPRYAQVEKMRPGGVPASIVFTLHGRESTWDFGTHLHEGSPLRYRTRYIPKGRPLKPEPPYTFEVSAEDALYILKSLQRVPWRVTGEALQAIEAYNGTGYQRFHANVPSPYLWSGTNLYARGKYVADGRFSETAVDAQLGCAAILLRMRERGVSIPML